MIERAIILKIQKEQPNVQLFIKLILMINRIYYPQMIAITVFSSTLLLFLNNCALHSRYFSDELDALFF